MHRVKISITKAGKATVSAEGISGESCKDVTKAFENALGKVVSDQETSEYYESPDFAQAVNTNAY